MHTHAPIIHPCACKVSASDLHEKTSPHVQTLKSGLGNGSTWAGSAVIGEFLRATLHLQGKKPNKRGHRKYQQRDPLLIDLAIWLHMHPSSCWGNCPNILFCKTCTRRTLRGQPIKIIFNVTSGGLAAQYWNHYVFHNEYQSLDPSFFCSWDMCTHRWLSLYKIISEFLFSKEWKLFHWKVVGDYIMWLSNLLHVPSSLPMQR